MIPFFAALGIAFSLRFVYVTVRWFMWALKLYAELIEGANKQYHDDGLSYDLVKDWISDQLELNQAIRTNLTSEIPERLIGISVAALVRFMRKRGES